jgi:hypothetical protein
MHQGVRGFNDRAAIQLPSGLPAFYQPVNSNLSEYMLPFHVDSMTTSATCMDAPTMDYPHDIGIINQGRYDACEDFFTRGLARPSLSPASRHPPSHPSALPVYPFGREYGARGGHGASLAATRRRHSLGGPGGASDSGGGRLGGADVDRAGGGGRGGGHGGKARRV